MKEMLSERRGPVAFAHRIQLMKNHKSEEFRLGRFSTCPLRLLKMSNESPTF